MTLVEAKKFEAAIDMADCHGLPDELVSILGEFQRKLEMVLDVAAPQG